AVFIGIKLISRKKVSKDVKVDKEAFLKKIEKFDLNDEERNALLYILEKGGRASQAEVRNALGLPKTTAWRMFKRLEKQGLVKIIRGRKENWVELRP
ncbi:helix-turn-helix domain-containing protein, partial [Thermococcus sp. 21S9]|uniref:helix-turn-helix transcriptional regulator n=2 Tax=Thermococcus TaxID=2263 RepID=UPI0014398CA2